LCNPKLKNCHACFLPLHTSTTTDNNWLASIFWTHSTWSQIWLQGDSYSLEPWPRARSQNRPQASLWTTSARENRQRDHSRETTAKRPQQRDNSRETAAERQQQSDGSRATAAERQQQIDTPHPTFHTSHPAQEIPYSPATCHVFALPPKANQLFQRNTVLP
jgi:hypothetical protein